MIKQSIQTSEKIKQARSIINIILQIVKLKARQKFNLLSYSPFKFSYSYLLGALLLESSLDNETMHATSQQWSFQAERSNFALLNYYKWIIVEMKWIINENMKKGPNPGILLGTQTGPWYQNGTGTMPGPPKGPYRH